MKTKPEINDLRVWWIPQVPMKAFYVEVATADEGRKICQILADYDMFQYNNNIKPDYSNVGGLQIYEADSDGNGNPGWCDWHDEDGNDFEF